MSNYFRGWYYRCQSENQTLAIIPPFHKTKDTCFCEIQVITDTESFNVQFPFSDYQKGQNYITIADNRFNTKGILLDIKTADFHVRGSLHFSDLKPIQYDIMGPFKYVPFMQCRHSVFSMRHHIDGKVHINGIPYVFQNGIGYIEGDRGYSFPINYVWTQCCYPDGALMLSVADIPSGPLRFTGVIGIVLLHEKEYRIATYLGAKAVKITPEEIIVQQGSYTIIVKPQDFSGHPLRTPVSGAMSRTIYEHPSCSVYYRFEKRRYPITGAGRLKCCL